ncbi:Transthyretin-like family protein, partial [Oesophagostomum dentatum]
MFKNPVTFSNEDGRFQLDGCGDDFDWIPGLNNKIEPYVEIRHFCNNDVGETITLPQFKVFVPETSTRNNHSRQTYGGQT